ncbi:MAG: FAD:protein FMN transferase [Ilumatobacteraceae bacterium]
MNKTVHQIQHVEHVMGMAISIDIREPLPPPEALTEVITWLHHVDDTFSTYQEHTEITRFGRGQLFVTELSTEVQDMLLRCVELTDITNGSFDAYAVPAPNGTNLDPSGYVKGWAIERAATMLEAAGARNLCINAGGDIALRGAPSDVSGWRVGIRHPASPLQQATVVTVAGNVGIATSATYERGAHIIDPHTGQPTTDLASATVIGPDLGTADAYATALFVMGVEGLSWIEAQYGYDAYIITHDNTTHWTAGFPQPGW